MASGNRPKNVGRKARGEPVIPDGTVSGRKIGVLAQSMNPGDYRTLSRFIADRVGKGFVRPPREMSETLPVGEFKFMDDDGPRGSHTDGLSFTTPLHEQHKAIFTRSANKVFGEGDIGLPEMYKTLVADHGFGHEAVLEGMLSHLRERNAGLPRLAPAGVVTKMGQEEAAGLIRSVMEHAGLKPDVELIKKRVRFLLH